MDLVTGATGYVGGRLIERLLQDDRPLRALARNPDRLEPVAGVDVVAGDLVRNTGLAEALDGIDTAYYLVHSMERPGVSGNGDFGARDRLAATNFAEAARTAGVERIVYLGGIVPREAPLSAHLGSRLEVERILLEAAPRSTALRASILIGARSS